MEGPKQIFGTDWHDKHGVRKAKFTCACGIVFATRVGRVKNGTTKSCGCLRKQAKTLKHGQTGSPEWVAWAGMRGRCDNPKHRKYKHYGGRGIRIDSRWDTFEQFLKDMGKRPGPGYSLDRIDNNGNYEPGNCRWATAKQQQNNRRNNRK